MKMFVGGAVVMVIFAILAPFLWHLSILGVLAGFAMQCIAMYTFWHERAETDIKYKKLKDAIVLSNPDLYRRTMGDE